MSTQLRLVEPPARRRAPRRARPAKARTRRVARWSTDWRLDAAARRVGREGVAAARGELSRAAEGNGLRRAS